MLNWRPFSWIVQCIATVVCWMISWVAYAPFAFGADAPPAAIPVDIVFAIDSSESMGPGPPREILEKIAKQYNVPVEELARLFGKDVERRRVQAVTASLEKLKGQA